MKFSKYFAIEKKLKDSGMRIYRAELISDFTDGNTDSLKGLSATEYRELTNRMSAMLPAQQFKDDKANKMRKKVIALLCQCGYTKHDKPDMQRINEWCIKRGKMKVELNDYKVKDLPALIYQAEEFYNKTMNQL